MSTTSYCFSSAFALNKFTEALEFSLARHLPDDMDPAQTLADVINAIEQTQEHELLDCKPDSTTLDELQADPIDNERIDEALGDLVLTTLTRQLPYNIRPEAYEDVFAMAISEALFEVWSQEMIGWQARRLRNKVYELDEGMFSQAAQKAVEYIEELITQEEEIDEEALIAFAPMFVHPDKGLIPEKVHLFEEDQERYTWFERVSNDCRAILDAGRSYAYLVLRPSEAGEKSGFLRFGQQAIEFRVEKEGLTTVKLIKDEELIHNSGTEGLQSESREQYLFFRELFGNLFSDAGAVSPAVVSDYRDEDLAAYDARYIHSKRIYFSSKNQADKFAKRLVRVIKARTARKLSTTRIKNAAARALGYNHFHDMLNLQDGQQQPQWARLGDMVIDIIGDRITKAVINEIYEAGDSEEAVNQLLLEAIDEADRSITPKEVAQERSEEAIEPPLEAELGPSDEKMVRDIIKKWKMHGDKLHKDPALKKEGIPRHPEYVYRLDGQWRGWNHFLGTEEADPRYAENEMMDGLEDIAFSWMQHPEKLN